MAVFMNGILFAAACAAAGEDLCSYRISNRLVLPVLACGLLLHGLQKGAGGLADALAGCALPFILLFGLYALSMLGAGDIKLLMAEGALAGLQGSLFILIAALLTGGILSLLRMIKHRNFFDRFHFFLNYISKLTSKQNQTLIPYYHLKSPKAAETLHFSVCVAVGAGLWCVAGCL